MKNNIKALKLVFRPKLVKQALSNLWEIIEYNLNLARLDEAATDYLKCYGINSLMKLCFQWLVEEVLPRWSRELTEGHALALSEIEWNGKHEE